MRLKTLKHWLKAIWFKWSAKNYPCAPALRLPLEHWEVNSVRFLQTQNYSGVNWGKHLGEDCITKPGTPVFAIGKGRVVYSALHTSPHPPESEGKRGSNWGNIIIIAHKSPSTRQVFFSLYGHLGERLVRTGDNVELGQQIGTVAKEWSQENGWWQNPHLHFAIYVGPWRGVVLPGSYRSETEGRTKLEDWRSPTEFIQDYNISEGRWE